MNRQINLLYIAKHLVYHIRTIGIPSISFSCIKFLLDTQRIIKSYLMIGMVGSFCAKYVRNMVLSRFVLSLTISFGTSHLQLYQHTKNGFIFYYLFLKQIFFIDRPYLLVETGRIFQWLYTQVFCQTISCCVPLNYPHCCIGFQIKMFTSICRTAHDRCIAF